MISSANSTRPLACFDLDGTLVRGDTFLPFLASYAVRHGRMLRLVAVPFWLGLLALRLVSARQAKEGLIAFVLGGQRLADLSRHADYFWETWVKVRLRPPVLDRLREHQAAGHRVILISASPDLYVPILARHLGVAESICTRVAHDGHVSLGRIVGENCKGEAKVRLLRAHLGAQPLPAGSSGYGDSPSDEPLLRTLDRGFLVKRGQLLPVPRPPLPERRWSSARWAIPLVCLGVWGALVAATYTRAPKYSWDSAVYVEVAQSLVRGEGIVHRTIGGVELPHWEPMALWPPGYPVFMAGLHLAGVPAPLAGVLVSLAAGAVFVLLQAWVCLRLLDWRMALPVALAATCMPALHLVSTNCLSDATFMALAVGSLACLIRASDRPALAGRWLAGAGLLAGAAWATRTAGLALLAAEAFYLLARPGRPARWREVRLWLGAAVLLIVPVLARNLTVFGRLNPYTMPPSTLSLAANLRATFAAAKHDLTALQAPVAWFDPRHAAVLAVAGLGLILWRRRQSLAAGLRVARRAASVHLLLLFAGLFVALIIAARTKYSWGEPIYWRYLVPVYWIAYLGLVLGLTQLLRALRVPGWARRAAVAAVFLLIAALQVRTHLQQRAKSQAAAGSLVAAIGEPAAQYLARSVTPDQLVLACRADLLRVHANLNARKIPQAPFHGVAYRRALEWAEVSRAARDGHLWGVVLEDPAGAHAGAYGPWIQELVVSPEKFPELKLLAIDGPARIFKFTALPEA